MSDAGRLQGGARPSQPASDWWWEWQEAEDLIVWGGAGGTIAFRAELDAIVDHFRGQRMPPIGATILLLSACRDAWDEVPTTGHLSGMLANGERDEDRRRIAVVVAGLRRVRNLPADLRGSLAARNVVADIVFESKRLPDAFDRSAWVVDQWSSPAATVAPGDDADARLMHFRTELRALLPGLFRVDERTVRMRVETGLDDTPRAAEEATLPEPRSVAHGGIPAEWLDDPELAAVARLARHVMAAVTLPPSLDAPADLPQGGIADIANRGPLDRLLLSELAHDETTLTARLALGEALYHRRELSAPPPPRCRLVLLDSGVRMWGVPRVYATAVALAIHAQSGSGSEARVFRAVDSGLLPIDLGSRAGLVEQLAVLEPSAHPGAALGPLAALLGAAGGTADAVVITGEEVAADPDFRRQMTACGIDPIHLVTVARDGRLRLSARSRRGSRLIREAVLDVEKLLAEEPGGTAAGGKKPRLLDRNLPAIFSADPFPLLLTVPDAFEHAWPVEGVGVLSITLDGRLLLWDTPGQGARQIADSLPRGKVLASDPTATAGMVLVVIGPSKRGRLHALLLDIPKRKATITALDVPRVGRGTTATIHQGRVLVRLHRSTKEADLIEIDPRSGRVLSTCKVPAGGRQIGRIVQNVVHGGTIALAAGPARYEPVPGDQVLLREALAVFDTAGIDGETIVTREGAFRFGADRKRCAWAGRKVPLHDMVFKGASFDGRRFVVAGSALRGDDETHVVQVPEGTFVSRPGNATLPSRDVWGDPRGAGFPAHIPPMSLAAVGLAPGGQLAFLPAHGGPVTTLGFVEGNLVIRPMSVDRRRIRGGASGSKCLARGVGLRSIRFADGTQAWIDSRGFVHLQSSVASLPEVTLLLLPSPHPLAGWLSDGRVFGPVCHHGGEPTDAAVIERDVLRPLLDAITE